MKTCRICQEEKALSDFYPDSRYRGGYKHECKSCDVARQRVARQRPDVRERRNQSASDWRRRNPEAARRSGRRSQIKATYGLTLEEYERLMAEAACPICGSPATVLDHHHESGRIRMPLCASCNAGIGMFKERADLMMNAVTYLADYST